MLRALRCSADAVRRLLLLFGIAFSATLAACGGGSGDLLTPATPATPPAASSVVTGTAAMGAAIANTLVTLKDSTNKAVTATTSLSGAFSLNSSSLTPPFLLQLTLPGGTRLLSVSTDANATATINITPLTDLVVRSWYNVQGRSADTAFANPATLAPPSPAQVRTMAQLVLNNLQLAIGANGAPVTDPLDLIAKPFAANGSGIDKLLDNTRVSFRSGAADLTLTAGTATQTTALVYTTATTSITASSTTVNGTVTTTSQSTDLVPVQDAQVAALDQIAAAMASVATTINTKGAALAPADLEPFFAADLLNEGLDRTQFLADVVLQFGQGGRTVAFAVDRIRSIDTAGGKAEALLRITETQNGASQTERQPFFFTKAADGRWRFAGDGRIAEVSVQAEGRSNQGNFSGDNGPSVNVDVRPLQGTVSSVSIASSVTPLVVTRGPTEVRDTGLQLDTFFANTGALGGTLPAAGTPVTVTLQKTAGGSVSYTVPLNAFTTELIHIGSPSGTTIRTGTTTVTWTLPTTYPVQRTKLSAQLFTGDQTLPGTLQCSDDKLVVAPTATSASLFIGATCSNLPVQQVNLNLSTEGPNGERSQATYSLTLVP